jgi:hypothetical protein
VELGAEQQERCKLHAASKERNHGDTKAPRGTKYNEQGMVKEEVRECSMKKERK